MSSPAWMQIAPVVLGGRHIRLEPLALSHVSALAEVGLDEELWRWIPVQVRTREDMLAYVRTALQWQAEGTALPFVTIEQTSGRAIGSTRFMNIDRANRHVEIGATWVARPWQRSAVNTEAKYLMLRHAFEYFGCLRVELKTDALNEKSRNAILRIGAKQEGIFRKHIVCDSGRVRDSVYFSIIDTEWPDVKAALEQKVAMDR
ncbi:MAG TPA: GNAT family protein [Bryobacteraceae bacterium]|nr:GNAT family protein [Bryobacteraceae bacterium]